MSKVKNNMENEKKFHKDYMEIKDQMITLKNQVNEKESINNKIKEELQTKDNRCKKLEIEITSIKSQNQDNIIKKTREEINVNKIILDKIVLKYTIYNCKIKNIYTYNFHI